MPQRWSPYAYAAEHGIQIVHVTHIEHGGRTRWVPERNTIEVRDGLTHVEERTFLAHELGHAMLGHDCSTARGEGHAYRWAALHLISPESLAAAQAQASTVTELCLELGVTPHLLTLYLALTEHERVHDPQALPPDGEYCP